ncbi:MAG TPA: penicillin acylase family protein [Spirochaetota bacterium]|nr:penicillin acylase family protein [Spirochaetota bacterium]
MNPTLSKWFKISAIAIVALVVIAFISFQVFFRLAVPSYTGTVDIPGLKEPVEVRTDDHGIPHILAKNDEDLFFAQGYITARERMFQMDLTRLAGRGELSTFFGEKTLETDRYFKTLGFYRASTDEYRRLSPPTKLAVDAYTRGVNAYLATTKRLPREYFILGAKPSEWKAEDCLVGALLMSYRLSAPRSTKAILQRIYDYAGAATLNRLLPWVPADAPVISGEPPRASSAVTVRDPGTRNARRDETAAAEPFCPVLMRQRASNWMIFSGSRTATGKAVFTGSPDLEAVIPSLFYLVHLKGGSYDVIGGSIAGLPGVHAVGFNGRIAWSITVGNGDNVDFFVEKPDPANPNRYLTENGYRNFTVIEDPIKVKVKGGFREEKLTVRVSRHGPVISAVMKAFPPNCAMLWPGLMGRDGSMDGLLTLNRARTFAEFRSALGMVRGASVHLGYADVDGNIGYQYVSTLPVRKGGENPVAMPGEKGAHDWTGFLPYERHPYEYNPKKGYVASFNQMPETAPFYGTAFFLFERGYRFEEMVRTKERFTIDEIRAMQNDTGSNLAKRFVPYIAAACAKDAYLAPYAKRLEAWDRFVSTESVEATIFNAFVTKLIGNTFTDELGAKIVDEFFKDLYVSIPVQWLIRYLDEPGGGFWDDMTTKDVRETRDDMIAKSMRDALAQIGEKFGANEKKWAWGRVHKMMIKHPLGTVLPFLNLGPYEYAGDDFTIHAGWWDRYNPFDMKSGAAIRLVVDMADLSTMTVMSPPGQSGHYLSPHYADLAETWAKGGQVSAHYTSAEKLDRVLSLAPAKR